MPTKPPRIWFSSGLWWFGKPTHRESVAISRMIVECRQILANWNSATPDTAKTYWANGLLKSIDNGVSKSEYAYNIRNLLTSETQTLAGRPARVVQYQHDADGLRTKTIYPGGQTADYTWTARGQLETVNSDLPPPPDLATYTYDKAGRNTALVHENGIAESKSYDAASQLLANTHFKNGTAVSGHGYTLDATGRRTDETFADGTTPAREYHYDNADQVTSADYGNSQSDTYAYDEMGNRTNITINGRLPGSGSPATAGYTANNANQYTSITGLNPISHDANGNLLQQNGVLYTWDSENRLLSVAPAMPALGDKSLVHTYDGQHRRVTRTIREWTVSGWDETETTHFIYDGWNVIEEYDITTSNSVLVRNLTWGQDLGGSSNLQAAGGVGGLLMVEEITGTTTTAYHFHYDGNGNVTEVTDLNGNSAATYRYDAFGNTLSATGSYATENRYRFSTKPLDGEVTNAPLYYYGYRYYDPATGRWPSRDPIGEKGGINLYGFVGNGGINHSDHLGLVTIMSELPEGCEYDHNTKRIVCQDSERTEAVEKKVKKYEETLVAELKQQARHASYPRNCPSNPKPGDKVLVQFEEASFTPVIGMYFSANFYLGTVAVPLKASGEFSYDCCAKKPIAYFITVDGSFSDDFDELVNITDPGYIDTMITFKGLWWNDYSGNF